MGCVSTIKNVHTIVMIIRPILNYCNFVLFSGPPHLMFNCQVAHQNCVYACPTPIQEAVARAFELELKRLESPECYFKSISVDLQQRRDMIVSILEEAGIPPVVPEVKNISSCTCF